MICPLPVRSSIPILIAFLCLALSVPLRAEPVNRIAAVVDDEVITVFDVEINAKPQITAYLAQVGQDSSEERRSQVSRIKKEVLRGLIEQKLLEREVTRLGIPVEDQDIDGQIEKIMAANRMTREDLSAALEREGKTPRDTYEVFRF